MSKFLSTSYNCTKKIESKNQNICDKCRKKLKLSRIFSLLSIILPIVVLSIFFYTYHYWLPTTKDIYIFSDILKLILIILGLIFGCLSQLIFNVGYMVGIGRIGIIINVIFFILFYNLLLYQFGPGML